METHSAMGFTQILSHIVGNVARAVSERNGETRQQSAVRAGCAAHMILGMLPRDVIEAMIAGHCVMLHELMISSVCHTLTGELETTRRATRGGIVAMDKAFGGNLIRLENYRTRPLMGPGVEAPVDARVDSPMDEPLDETVAPSRDIPEEVTISAPEDIAADDPAAVDEAAECVDNLVPSIPTAAMIAACRANPEAMAALDAGDPEAFARAMGIENPSEAFLEAATAPGGPFDVTVPAHRRPLVSRLPR